MEDVIPRVRDARAQRWTRVGWWTAALLALLSGALALLSLMRWFEPIADVEPDPPEAEVADDMLAEPTVWADDTDEAAWQLDEEEDWASIDDVVEELEEEGAPADATEPIWIGGPEPDPVDHDHDGIDRVRALLEERRTGGEIAAEVEPGEEEVYDPGGDGAVALDEGGSTEDSATIANDKNDSPPRRAPGVLARLLLREALILALGIVLLALQRFERDRSSAIAGAFFATAALLRVAGLVLSIDDGVGLYAVSEPLAVVACVTTLWTARRGRLPLVAMLLAIWASYQLPWHWDLSGTGPVALARRVGPWVLLAIAFTDRGRAPSEAAVVPVAAAGPYRAAPPRPPVHDVSWAPIAVVRTGAAWLATATILRLLEPSYHDAWRYPDAQRGAADLALAAAAAVAAGRTPAGGARRALSIAAALFAVVPLSRVVAVRVLAYGQIAATLVAGALLATAIVATLVALERLARDHGRSEGGDASLHPAELAMVIAGAVALPWVVGPTAPRIGVGWLFLAMVVAVAAGVFWQTVRRVARQIDDGEPVPQPDDADASDKRDEDDDEHPSVGP